MNIIHDPNQPDQQSKQEPTKRFYITGLALIIVGCLIFLDRLTNVYENWFFQWEYILILAGIYVGEKNQFKGLSWVFCIGIGAFFLLDEWIPHFNIKLYIGPIAVIALGIYFLFCNTTVSHKRSKDKNIGKLDLKNASTEIGSDEEFINISSIFGGINKNIYSKNFIGGKATSIFGGSEINLQNADFNGNIFLELTQIFGGCTLIVPLHWNIKTEVVNIFGGVEDLRPVHNPNIDASKVLTIKGTSIFGGIEIKSYA